MPDYIIIGLIVLILGGIWLRGRKLKKQGISGCGCSCSSCGNGACPSKVRAEKEHQLKP